MSSGVGWGVRRGPTQVLLALILLFVLAVSLSGVVWAQETGRIEVLVEGYDGSSVLTAALVDSSGDVVDNRTFGGASFAFNGVSLGEDYTVVIGYKGVDYSESVTVDEASQSLTVQVYDVTDSDEAVVVSLYQVSIKGEEDGALGFVEYIVFENTGETVVRDPSFRIEIPSGYRDFQWDRTCCLEFADFGIFYRPTEPLMPGATQTINFRYTLDVDSDEYSFVKRFYYDVVDAYVAVDPALDVVDFTNLWDQGTTPSGDGDVNLYGASTFLAGESVLISVSGYRGGGGDLNLLWVGTGVLVAVIVGAFFFGFRRSRGSPEKLKIEEEALESVTKQLDKDHADKKISEVEYLKLRLKYRKRLENVRERIRQTPKK
jgi:hypothetical protein